MTDLEKAELLSDVRTILAGIDGDEIEVAGGWWETSVGAAFGKERLEALIARIERL